MLKVIEASKTEEELSSGTQYVYPEGKGTLTFPIRDNLVVGIIYTYSATPTK